MCVSAAGEKGVLPSQIVAIGITNQRETTVVWDRRTGQPFCNAILWKDARTSATVEEIASEITTPQVISTTGLRPSTYFSGVKMRWMIANVPGVREAVADGTAMFGTIDTWLVWNLSVEAAYVTDVTNAGRTMLMDIRDRKWDKTMMDLIGVSPAVLPDIRSCSELFGTMKDTVLKGVRIAGIIGDQQAALVGQACFNVGELKNTYGTGCFLIVNTGEEPKFSNHRLLTTPAYQMGPKAKCIYSLEGSVAVAGAVIEWMKDKLDFIDHASEVEALARSVPDTGDVYCVPAFSGLFAPRWRDDARGVFAGITLSTTKAHMARAMLAGITHQVNDVVRAASEDMGADITELRVDGGASRCNLLLEMQANITGTSVVRPRVVETTALGAAFAAGHAVGLFQSEEEFARHWAEEMRFTPQITEEQRNTELCKWEAAVDRSLGWTKVGNQISRPWWEPPMNFVVPVISAVSASVVTALIMSHKQK